ncbi:MAG: hypothetical protein HZB26_00735 [Candidatus Hydrogenedentes bacterium]|nr:hypothetical protein [Candidatus Hydrogenedentota bacterium]
MGTGSHKRVIDDLVEYVPYAKIELKCKDALVERIIAVTVENAHIGLCGDGRIYVYLVECAVRIGTGERGEATVQRADTP